MSYDELGNWHWNKQKAKELCKKCGMWHPRKISCTLAAKKRKHRPMGYRHPERC